ncbi:SurA N-terminal domain-containing protein [Dokdonella sp.]|uniref:SurA N-terminal domain-containing protein n=1 Tax=Dokdonella sp. TaxID=2291710 RepID=UPI0035270F67
MLQDLRAKTSGLIAKIILGAIVVAFSFFGIESYFIGRTDTFVARIGDKEISQQEFRTRFDEFRQQQLQRTNGAIDARIFDQPDIKRRILDQMIDEQVLLNANEKYGIAIPADRLREEISSIPAFQRDGAFDAALYRARLSAQGMTPNAFAERVAEELAAREIPVDVASSAFATDKEVDELLRLRGQLRDFSFVTLTAPEPASTEIPEQELTEFYEAHQQDYMNPELVALEYVEVNAQDLAVQLVADEATLKDRYEKEKFRFVTTEQRLASHILIKVQGDGGPDEQKKALEAAEAVSARIKAGEDFAELAKTESADLGSRALGGDLGWMDKGMTDPAFEEALYALEKGQVSDPVLSSEGYHIIEVRDIRPGAARSFEEVREELASEYAESERERAYNELSGRLIDLSYEDSTSLAPAAAELGLKVEKTELFSRSGGSGLAGNPEVVRAAFSDPVLLQGNNSDQVELGPNHMAVVRVSEHKPATPKPMAEVKDQVEQRVIAERVSKQAQERADELFARLEKGESLPALAQELTLEVQDQQGIGRSAVNVDQALVSAAFALPRPAGGKSEFSLVTLGGDSFALLELKGVTDADPAAADQPTREAARNTIKQANADAAAREFVAALRAGMEIEISEERW